MAASSPAPAKTIPVGTGPSAVVVGRAGVWVANELDSTVSLIDPTTDRVLASGVEGAPDALAPTGNAVWVAGSRPQLTLLSPSGQARTIAVPSPTTALATSSGRLLVAVSGSGAAHRGGTLIVRISNPEPSIDPSQCCNTPGNVEGLSYDGLLAFSKNPASPGTLVPDLALAIPKPEDGRLSYTFHLRPGLRYRNGTAVRASDFRRGLELAAQGASTWAAYLTALPGTIACPYAVSCDLSSAVITNDKAGTVTLRLSRPDPGLLTVLGQLAFAPAPPGGGIRPGTGPYRIARIVPSRLIVFTRNPYFREWAPAAQPAGYPNQIDVYMNGTPTTDAQAVLQGRADYTFDQPTASQLREIDLLSPGLLHSEPLPDTEYLDLDTRLAPFNDVRVRQALNYAINRNTIVKLYGGPANATPTCKIIPATIPGHVPYCPYTRHPSPNGRWSAPNLTRARQLVALSGTRGQIVTIRTQSQSGPAGEPVAKYVVQALRQLGYRPQLIVVSADEVATGAVTPPRSSPTPGSRTYPHCRTGSPFHSAAARGAHRTKPSTKPSSAPRRSTDSRPEPRNCRLPTPLQPTGSGRARTARSPTSRPGSRRSAKPKTTSSQHASATINTSRRSVRCSTNSGYAENTSPNPPA